VSAQSQMKRKKGVSLAVKVWRDKSLIGTLSGECKLIV
jgi:hypothetical protein